MMDNVCRSCNHHRSEKAYQSGAKVIMTAPGDWCAGSRSPLTERHELIPCDVSRASWAGCKQAAELYEPKVASAPNEPSEPMLPKASPIMSEPVSRTAPNLRSEPFHKNASTDTSEPPVTKAPYGVSADLFDERPNA